VRRESTFSRNKRRVAERKARNDGRLFCLHCGSNNISEPFENGRNYYVKCKECKTKSPVNRDEVDFLK